MQANIAASKTDKIALFESAPVGSLFFSSSRTLISWLIRKITKFHRSHVFVKINDRTLIEADVGGIALKPIKTYIEDSRTEIELVLLPKCVNKKVFIDEISSRIGSFYDYGILLGSVISRIFKITRWRANILNGISRYTCSELVSECLISAGYSFRMPPSQITPKELYLSLTKRFDDSHTKIGENTVSNSNSNSNSNSKE